MGAGPCLPYLPTGKGKEGEDQKGGERGRPVWSVLNERSIISKGKKREGPLKRERENRAAASLDRPQIAPGREGRRRKEKDRKKEKLRWEKKKYQRGGGKSDPHSHPSLILLGRRKGKKKRQEEREEERGGKCALEYPLTSPLSTRALCRRRKKKEPVKGRQTFIHSPQKKKPGKGGEKKEGWTVENYFGEGRKKKKKRMRKKKEGRRTIGGGEKKKKKVGSIAASRS